MHEIIMNSLLLVSRLKHSDVNINDHLTMMRRKFEVILKHQLREKLTTAKSTGLLGRLYCNHISVFMLISSPSPLFCAK